MMGFTRQLFPLSGLALAGKLFKDKNKDKKQPAISSMINQDGERPIGSSLVTRPNY
jgi:hypothetical protein